MPNNVPKNVPILLNTFFKSSPPWGYYSIKAKINQCGALYHFCRRQNIVYTARCNIVDAKHHIVYGVSHNIVLCPLKRNDVILRINDVASKLANDVVSLRTQTQKEKASQMTCFSFWLPLLGSNQRQPD